VLVEFQLDDGTWASPTGARYQRGGPLDLSRHELEEEIRGLIFSQPRYSRATREAEPPLLVEELQHLGSASTLEVLAALPLRISLSD
jgi:hypothetical protein